MLMHEAVCELELCCTDLQTPVSEAGQERLLCSAPEISNFCCAPVRELSSLDRTETARRESCMAGGVHHLSACWQAASLCPKGTAHGGGSNCRRDIAWGSALTALSRQAG